MRKIILEYADSLATGHSVKGKSSTHMGSQNLLKKHQNLREGQKSVFTNLLGANRENQEASDIFHAKNYNETPTAYEQRSKSVVNAMRLNAASNQANKSPKMHEPRTLKHSKIFNTNNPWFKERDGLTRNQHILSNGNLRQSSEH